MLLLLPELCIVFGSLLTVFVLLMNMLDGTNHRHRPNARGNNTLLRLALCCRFEYRTIGASASVAVVVTRVVVIVMVSVVVIVVVAEDERETENKGGKRAAGLTECIAQHLTCIAYTRAGRSSAAVLVTYYQLDTTK